MGPENSGGPFVAYLDGQPVELALKPIQFTVAHLEDGEIVPDYSAGGVTAEEAAAAAERLAAKGLQAFFCYMELSVAVYLARIFKPNLARRYIHTRKKRIRKKYEKRILAWFREVFQ